MKKAVPPGGAGGSTASKGNKNPDKTTGRDNSKWRVRKNLTLSEEAEDCKTCTKLPAHAITDNHSIDS